MIAVLVDIRSALNVGSIFRTADAAGFEKVYLTGITPEPIDQFGRPRSDIAKVALGAEKSLAWEKAKTPARLIEKLKKNGYFILALEQSDRSLSFNKFKPKTEKLALLLGNEVTGLPKKILALADAAIEIPMLGKKESLNVSVAFGIAAYQLVLGGKLENGKKRN